MIITSYLGDHFNSLQKLWLCEWVFRMHVSANQKEGYSCALLIQQCDKVPRVGGILHQVRHNEQSKIKEIIYSEMSRWLQNLKAILLCQVKQYAKWIPPSDITTKIKLLFIQCLFVANHLRRY